MADQFSMAAITALATALHRAEVLDLGDFIGELRGASEAAPPHVGQQLSAYAALLTRVLAKQSQRNT
ncbi:hypothetical protein [Thermomonas mangrovi]|uniref:hypothetical protein n=1 Tax=Thermomonas mangrovi TaxID=2993316 RepID=UPI002307BE70|nr:hypothetical protein [Thermomonas mangrovi]